MNHEELIKQRLSMLTDPSRIKPKTISNKILLEKCNEWNAIYNKSIWNNSKITLHHSLSNAIIPSITTQVRTIIKEQVSESLWHILQHAPYGTVVDHILSSTFVHAYAKFTSKEFKSFLNDTYPKPTEILKLHTKFKDLDWFWDNGLYHFKSQIEPAYYVQSYYNKNYYQKIKIPTQNNITGMDNNNE